MPHAALLQLSTAGGALTLDLRASDTLGFPLVVLHPAAAPAFLTKLTAREREVARLLADGRCNKEIAAALGITLGTTKDHVHAVLRKSGLSSRLEVASAFMSRAS